MYFDTNVEKEETGCVLRYSHHEGGRGNRSAVGLKKKKKKASGICLQISESGGSW